ncbi:Uncharacterised protein [Mycobacteroides abscessus subsp. abscessus]|nr:Uncharacterised protein [Mycobacteroides abscessus subsp. abscessus]
MNPRAATSIITRKPPPISASSGRISTLRPARKASPTVNRLLRTSR